MSNDKDQPKRSRKRPRPKEGQEQELSSSVESGRTQSFGVLWAGALSSVGKEDCPDVAVHTLILGTHPSPESLARRQYFGHPSNAFWWIAGDCLGFRRGSGVSPSSGKPYAFAPDLRVPTHNVLDYASQVETLCHHGFALWDLIGSCRREGALDQNIEEETPNDVKAFVEAHPTVERIVMANGHGQCKLFLKHFREWWDNDDDDDDDNDGCFLVPEDNDLSRKVFGSRYSRRLANPLNGNRTEPTTHRRIVHCVCMLGVSPANARFTYTEKRSYWEKFCYEPGLRLHQKHNGSDCHR